MTPDDPKPNWFIIAGFIALALAIAAAAAVGLIVWVFLAMGA